MGISFGAEDMKAKEGMGVVELFDEECSMTAQMMAPISTITFFETKVSEAEYIGYLRERVRRILEANPWLGGSFVKIDGKKQLIYSRKVRISERMF